MGRLDGKIVRLLAGPAYTVAKHGLVAISHSINVQECVNGRTFP